MAKLDFHGRNSEQARRRIKKQRQSPSKRADGTVGKSKGERAWLKVRRRIRRGILGR